MKPPSSTLAISRPVIRQLAGPKSFERGELYARQGRVKKLTGVDASIRATVHGTGKYRVDLAIREDGDLDWSCSCPVGADGGFCKHCVAVALVASGGSTRDAPDETTVDVFGYLRDLDHERLVELVVDLAANDELLAGRLQLAATRAQATGAPPLRPFKDAIDAVFVTHDYVDYRSAYDFASNIDAVLDSLDELLADGHEDTVIELAEHALVRVEDVVGYVDDSDGWLGGIAERSGSATSTSPRAMKPNPTRWRSPSGCSRQS